MLGICSTRSAQCHMLASHASSSMPGAVLPQQYKPTQVKVRMSGEAPLTHPASGCCCHCCAPPSAHGGGTCCSAGGSWKAAPPPPPGGGRSDTSWSAAFSCNRLQQGQARRSSRAEQVGRAAWCWSFRCVGTLGISAACWQGRTTSRWCGLRERRLSQTPLLRRPRNTPATHEAGLQYHGPCCGGTTAAPAVPHLALVLLRPQPERLNCKRQRCPCCQQLAKEQQRVQAPTLRPKRRGRGAGTEGSSRGGEQAAMPAAHAYHACASNHGGSWSAPSQAAQGSRAAPPPHHHNSTPPLPQNHL